MVKLYNSSPLAGSAGGDPGPRALLAAVDAVEALFFMEKLDFDHEK